jgi:hypothetical protein
MRVGAASVAMRVGGQGELPVRFCRVGLVLPDPDVSYHNAPQLATSRRPCHCLALTMFAISVMAHR